MTTHEPDCHVLRSGRWGYIRYKDGSEELCDHENDKLEWYNLAQDPEHAAVKRELARWLPKASAPRTPSTKDLKKQIQIDAR